MVRRSAMAEEVTMACSMDAGMSAILCPQRDMDMEARSIMGRVTIAHT